MLPQLYECFQHWSAGGSVYIYSDPHFEDSDCKTIDATWPAPEEQIAKINAKVHKGDTLIILGDIGNPEWIKQIKAHYKILIAGNHDAGLSNYERKYQKLILDKEIFPTEKDARIHIKNNYKEYDTISCIENYSFHSPFDRWIVTISNNLFDEVYGGPLFIGEKILLSHEPIYNECWYNLHGHRHSDDNTNYKGENYFNCCANVIKYEPINLKDIINSGALKNIPTIHRKTIDIASSK